MFKFEDIKKATNNFAKDNIVKMGGLGVVYKGKLLRPEGLITYAFIRVVDTSGKPAFSWKERITLIRLKNENISTIVGYCEESAKMDVHIYEFHSRRSLDLYLSSAELTWLKRLQICLGGARGLSYLHGIYVIHRNIRSTHILLDDNWQAKIVYRGRRGLTGTVMGNGNDGRPFIYNDNVDPMYFESNTLTKESDIYSFGMVLFEVLCGKQASTSEPLSKLARHHYENGTLAEIIDPILRKQMSPKSLDIFSAIAHQCLQRSREERPTILQVEKKIEEALEHQLVFEAEQKISFEYLKIPLKEIHLATNGFHDDHLIGLGGFGGVYKAELIHFDVRKYVRKNGSHEKSVVKNDSHEQSVVRLKSKVAVKKLDSRYGQGKEQFLREIEVLSNLNHENIVSLVGFCDEDGEMILVYEYASNGSLDRHIGKIHKVYSHTWAQRLKICLDVAHGLNYLHNKGIIHRDIKSANILIGQNQEGMIGDFGLSRIKKNTNVDFSITNVAGTPAYVEPKYARTGKLSKQSDIYSLGVVLVEVFCGRLAVPPQLGDDPEYLLHEAERHFKQKTFNKMIDPYLNEEFEKSCANSGDTSFSDSINTFVEITYKCLHNDEAPNLTMMEVVEELKKAWTFLVEEAGNIKPDFYRSFKSKLQFWSMWFSSTFKFGPYFKVITILVIVVFILLQCWSLWSILITKVSYIKGSLDI